MPNCDHTWVLTRDGGQPICEACGTPLETDVWLERLRKDFMDDMSDITPPVDKSANVPPYGDNLA